MPLNLGGNEITSLRAKLINETYPIFDGLLFYLDAGLTDSYPGSGTTWTDLSLGGINGTLTNGPTFSSGSGGNILFDGTNDYIQMSPTPSLSNVSQFSYSAFVNFNTRATGNAFFSYGSTTGDSRFNNDILLAWDSGSSQLFYQINNASDGSGAHSFTSLNTWVNITVVYDGSLSGNSNRLKAYINASQVTLTFDYTVPATTASPSSPSCRLATYVCDSSNAFSLNGRIANTLLYNRALTSTEILQNFNAFRGRFGI